MQPFTNRQLAQAVSLARFLVEYADGIPDERLVLWPSPQRRSSGSASDTTHQIIFGPPAWHVVPVTLAQNTN
jgi:hypothetical protein